MRRTSTGLDTVEWWLVACAVLALRCARSGEFGYSRIVANATAFRLEYIGDQRGEIHDTLHLTKA